jgi:hypothetical protein
MTSNALTTPEQDRQLLVGATADQYAREGVFADYQARRARNTLRRQRDDLATFADYLAVVQFYATTSDEAQRLYSDPAAWSGITYGLIAGFVRWLLASGYAVGTVNLKLSTVKQYAKLAFQAQALSAEQHALIRTVTGFQFKEHKRVNEQRSAGGTATRLRSIACFRWFMAICAVSRRRSCAARPATRRCRPRPSSTKCCCACSAARRRRSPIRNIF